MHSLGGQRTSIFTDTQVDMITGRQIYVHNNIECNYLYNEVMQNEWSMENINVNNTKQSQHQKFTVCL